MYPSSKTIIRDINVVTSLSLQIPDAKVVSSLRAHLSRIWQEGTGADLRLVMESDIPGSSKTVNMPCHSVILISRSGYFQKKLTAHKFNRKQEPGIETSFRLANLPIDTTSLFFALEYMYTGSFNIVIWRNSSLLSNLYRAAVFLSIPALQAEVETYITSEIHPGSSLASGNTSSNSAVDRITEVTSGGKCGVISCSCGTCETHIRDLLEFIIENAIYNHGNTTTTRALASHLGPGWRWCSDIICRLIEYVPKCAANGSDALSNPVTVFNHLCLAESALEEIDSAHKDSALHTTVKKMVLEARDIIDAKVCISAGEWIVSDYWKDSITEARMNAGDALDSCKWILSSFIRGFKNMPNPSNSHREMVINMHKVSGNTYHCIKLTSNCSWDLYSVSRRNSYKTPSPQRKRVSFPIRSI